MQNYEQILAELEIEIPEDKKRATKKRHGIRIIRQSQTIIKQVEKAKKN